MGKNIALIVAGVIFSFMALAHLLRIIFQVEIIVNHQIIPLWGSYTGFIITLLLAIWMFVSAKKS